MTICLFTEVPKWLYVYWNAAPETDHKLKVSATKYNLETCSVSKLPEI